MEFSKDYLLEEVSASQIMTKSAAGVDMSVNRSI
jgi:hypothetical protein